jgi:3-phosphoshikimate 1-carboxyvinyltransferase
LVAAAALVEGSQVVLPGVGVNPTRIGFLDVLREMGARVEFSGLHESAGEPVAKLKAGYAPLRAVRVPAQRVPALIDEVPLLAVVAASAEGTTRIEGLGELRHKESDRLAGIAAALSAMGGAVRVDGDALEVRGPTRLRGAPVETLGDHRLAMAFAVAALAAQGETTLSDADCAGISYPAFFAHLEALRG